MKKDLVERWPGIFFREIRLARDLYGLIVGSLLLALVITGLAGAELYARHVQGYLFWSWPLAKSYFFELDRLKLWNRRFYEKKLEYFSGWPVKLELFDADKATPRYLFKPSLRMTRQGTNTLVPSGPNEDVFWSSNSWGFRGPEVSVKKPSSVIRIVCLGASTTEGSQGDQETYPYFLEQELRRVLPNHAIEVINAGHHGQGIDDLLEILRQRVMPLEPDIVIFYETSNNINFAEFTKDIPCKMGFPNGDCWLHPYPGWYRWLYKHSAIFVLLSNRLARGSHTPQGMPHEFDNGSLKPSAIHYKDVLRHIVGETLAHGSTMVLSSFVTLAHEGLEVSYEDNPLLFNDLYMKWYPFTPGELERIYQHFNRQSAEVAREFRVPHVDVAAKFPRDSRYFPFDLIHLSPEGNKLLATIFATYLAEKVLPEFTNERQRETRER